MRAWTVLVCCLFLVTAAGRCQPAGMGHWEGAIDVAGQSLEIKVDFSAAEGSIRGTIDIPQQKAFGLPLRAVRLTGDSVSFELPAGPGLASFEGGIAGDTASGVFRQAGITGTFHLRRGTAARAAEPAPAGSLPYASFEVSFRSGDCTLAGTLTVPFSGGPYPAVILLTGSGAQTRDEDVFGFKVFGVLADTLTRSGVAVLRFDDRGRGGSGGSAADATTAGYSVDALSAFAFLAAYPGVDATRIGFLGHSEGAVAASLAAAQQPAVAFLVLMAGPAQRGDRVILGQIEDLGRSAGMTSEEINEKLALQQRVYDVVRSNTGWDSLRVLLEREIRSRSPGADSLVRLQVEGQMRTVRSPWFRSFIDLDPVIALRQVSIPVLAILGEKDVQVPPAANRPVFENLREKEGKKNLTIVVVPGANHLFQSANSGEVGEYATLKREFSAGFTGRLLPWVVEHAGLRK